MGRYLADYLAIMSQMSGHVSREYIVLLPSYDDGVHGEAEDQRISNLKKELTAGRKLQLGEDGKPLQDKDGNDLYVGGDEGKVPSYDDILSIAWKKEDAVGKNKEEPILQVTIKTDAYEKMKPSANSTNDPYLDLLDTLDTMKAFVTRRVEALLTDSSSGGETSVALDLVIGETKVPYNSIDGANSSINIFYTALENAVSTRVNGMNADGSKLYTQYVIPYHDVEDFENDKMKALEALLGKDDKRVTKDFSILRGSVILKEGTASPEDVCLIFGKDETGNEVYLGAVERCIQKENGKDVYGFRGINGTITDISFSHMVVEKDNSDKPTVLYTDGRYDLSKTLVPYSVSQAIYLVYDTSNAAQLPGNKDQNSYFFALTPANGLDGAYVLFSRSPETDKGNEIGEIIKELPPESASIITGTQQTQQAAAAVTRSAETSPAEEAGEPENNTNVTADTAAGTADGTTAAGTDVTAETAGDVAAEAADDATISENEVTDTTVSKDGENTDTAISEGEDSSDDTTVSEGGSSSDDTTVSEGNDASDDTTVSEGDDASDDTTVSEGDDASDDTTVSEGDDASVSEGDGSSEDSSDPEDEGSDDSSGSGNGDAADNTGGAEPAAGDTADEEPDVSELPDAA